MTNTNNNKSIDMFLNIFPYELHNKTSSILVVSLVFLLEFIHQRQYSK